MKPTSQRHHFADQRFHQGCESEYPREERTVQLLSEAAGLGVLHDGHVAREVQGDGPRPRLWSGVRVTPGPRCLGRQAERSRRQPLHLARVGQNLAIRLGRVQDVVGELCRQLSQLLREVTKQLRADE